MAILLIKAHENSATGPVRRWRKGQVVAVFEDGHEFGAREVVAAGNFHHITVTNRTKAQADIYMQDWMHDADVQQIQANGNQRRIEVTSTMVSASGKHAFTRAGVEELLADIGGTYVSRTDNSFRFDIVADISERDEIMDQINKAVRRMGYEKRRWYITAAGMTALENNGGELSGTAAQVSPYLRDGLLD